MTPAPRDDGRDAADAAATQHSLNRALGSLGMGRRKPWMTSNLLKTSRVSPPFTTQASVDAHIPRPSHQSSASTSLSTPGNKPMAPNCIPPAPVLKRKRGQPPKHQLPPLDPPQLPHERTVVDLGRGAHALSTSTSTSTSPKLANSVSKGQAAVPSPNDITILPSPSPSPDTTSETIKSKICHVPPNPDRNYPRASDHTGQETASPRPNPLNMTSAMVLQQAARPSNINESTPAPISHSLSGHRRETSIDQVTSRPPSTVQVQSHSPSIGQQLSSYASPHRIHQGIQNHSRAVRTPPQIQAPFGAPRSLSVGGVQQQPYELPHGSHGNSPHVHYPAVSSPLAPLEYFTQTDCARALDQFPSHLHNGKRLAILKEAVERQDWDYLTMHQNYCLFNADPQRLSPHRLHHPNLKCANDLMARVLDHNEKLSPPALQFFANFPMPTTQIATKWPRAYQQQELKFFRFMVHSTNFEALTTSCIQRSLPPDVRQLHEVLAITSPIFQRIVFTAILRHLWSSTWTPTLSQQNFEAEAIAIFTQNQEHFMQTENPNSLPNSVENDEQHWGRLLKQLCARRELWLRQHQQQLRAYQIPALRAMPPQTAQTAQVATALGRASPRVHGPVQPQLTFLSQSARPILRGRGGGFRPLFPESGYNQPCLREPNPARSSLHHANLRSPILKAQSPGSVLYQYMKTFAKAPVRFKEAGRNVEIWSLPVTNMVTIPKNIPGLRGEPMSRAVNEGNDIIRLRCIKWPSKRELPNDNAWSVADTSWAPKTYLTFNGNPLYPRKKLYHGKDLPIDISSLIREGDNTLEIAVLRQPDDEQYLEYLLAIEVVGFQSHETIIQNCLTTNHVPAAQTVEAIKRKLSGNDVNDDEIAIVASNLTINLLDPFSASKICEIPARSKACLHFDCFDLETFLQTRPRKGDVSVADHWRCPICSEDARPHKLIVDGFLEEVRKSLEYNGLLETRAIVMEQNGSWKPRVETVDLNGLQDRDNSDNERQHEPASVLTATFISAQRTPIEFIDLGD